MCYAYDVCLVEYLHFKFWVWFGCANMDGLNSFKINLNKYKIFNEVERYNINAFNGEKILKNWINLNCQHEKYKLNFN